MRLDERLIEERTTDGGIDFHKHISKVRKEASSWLKGIEKNGIDHSKRLEGYLDQLIPDVFKEKLKPAEVFILLYAVYLHDIGYRNEQGEIESNNHPLRSKNYILKDPRKYLFDQFPSMKKGEAPLAAQAVAEVCYGHTHESVCPLQDISNDFGDQNLCQKGLNLRRLAALLRLADEMDQAYIRLGHLRNSISLPAISSGIVRMHWKGDQSVGKALGDLVQGINETLEPVNDLLSEWDFPKTTVVLEPLVKKPPPPPQEQIDYKKLIPEHSRTESIELPEWHKLLQEELNRLSIGKIVFNPPDVMKVGVKDRIETRITGDIKANLQTSLKGRGIPKTEELKISALMKVQLSGSDFNIIHLNEEEQVIEEIGFTEWAWDVTPQRSGKKVLHLHVTLRIRLPHGEERKDHPVLDREIVVKVNPAYSVKTFIVSYWKWIVTALILPLIGLVWKIYTK